MEAKDTKIYMIVDTEKIKVGNENQHVEFKDDRKNKDPKNDPKNFVSIINPGKKVFWFGESKDQPQNTIEIIDIQRKDPKQPEFLKTQGNDPSHKGAYMGQVIDDGKNEEESSYNVLFNIKNKDGQFKVDPKLLMKT